MYRTILVPLDGSPFSEHALPSALAIARRAGAQLRLVSVVTPLAEAYVEGLYFSTTDFQDQLTIRQQQYLDSIAARLRECAALTITTEVLHGEVAVSLDHLIDQGGIDLVVMATHGRGALARFWLGSVADEMLRHVNIPLLLVRPGAEAVDLAHEPALGKAVIALDGTALAEQILEPAIALVGLMPDADITLMRAIHSVVPVTATPDISAGQREARQLMEQVAQLQGKLRDESETYLEGVGKRLREKGVKVRGEVIVEDQAASAILHEVEATRAGLVAIATHARSGIGRLVLGSVADKVIRGAHTPVLVYHPKA